MKQALLWLILVLLPVLVLAQTPGSLGGPTLGYVFDKNLGVIRPLVGIVGSATVGVPIDLGFTLTQAIPFPDERHLIVAPSGGPFLISVDMGIRPPVLRSINGANASVSTIGISPHGASAVLFDASSQRVQVIGGLPNNPSMVLEFTAGELGFPLRRIAVNDDASMLVASFAEHDRESIYRWDRSRGFSLLLSVSQVGALSFAGAGDVVIADSGRNEVFLMHDIQHQAGTQFLAGAVDGVSNPVSIGVSSRNEIVVANAGSGTLMTFDANGRTLETLQCHCMVAGLYPLGPGLFRLTDRIDQTNYLFDSTGSENRIVFVPPLP